jgi:hypothetical protein
LNFLIDMPVTFRAVDRLIAAGHQAVHAASIGLKSARDAEILAVARAGRQIIVTADLDYPTSRDPQSSFSCGHLVPRWFLHRRRDAAAAPGSRPGSIESARPRAFDHRRGPGARAPAPASYRRMISRKIDLSPLRSTCPLQGLVRRPVVPNAASSQESRRPH